MAETMTRYVAGFLFSESGSSVALIEKRRPKWQAGKFNGIGGHIEEGETGAEAMRREFVEETGLDVEGWEHFATLGGDGFEVEFFRAAGDELVRAQSLTDEPVMIVPVLDVLFARIPTIPNLRWLVPMAMPSSRHDWPYRIAERATEQETPHDR